MIQFLVYGINHRHCPVEIRERLHFSATKRGGPPPASWRAGASGGRSLSEAFAWIRREWPSVETLILSTCNRVELYFAMDVDERATHALPAGRQASPLQSENISHFLSSFHGIDRAEFEHYAYRLEGQAAIEHLFRVAAGLDSMVVGENEILGQLKEAFRLAHDSGGLDSFLYRWAERALRVGKQVRTKTRINEGAVSVPSVAVELAEKIFRHLAGKKIMVLGTGEMSEMTLQSLRQAGGEALYVMSRSEERGRPLAEAFGAKWISWEEWERALGEIDILIASTLAPHPIVKFEMVRRAIAKRRHRPLFLIDIAVPRNIEAEVNDLDDVYLYDIDDLEEVAQSNLRLRAREMREAQAHIEAAVSEFEAWIKQLEAGPTIKLLQAYFDELVEEEIERGGIESEAERARFQEFARRLRSKFLHAPLEALKESSRLGTVRRTLEAIHTLFPLNADAEKIRISDRE